MCGAHVCITSDPFMDDALPRAARAPTPARIAAARKSARARKKDCRLASGTGIPRAVQ